MPFAKFRKKKQKSRAAGPPRPAAEEEKDALTFYWTMEAEEVAELLGLVDLQAGLTSSQVADLQHRHGANELHQGEGIRFHRILFHHLVNFMSFVLWGAFVLAMVTQQWVDAGVILFIIVFNTIIGVSQEYKSEKTMAALREMSSPTSRVIRDGQSSPVQIRSTELVPGDVVVLSQGDKIPADMRLISVTELECNEAALTGESADIRKKVEAIEDPDCPLGDRKNSVFMGSVVTKGKGMGLVVRIGQKTQLGRIADTVSKAKKASTQLEKKMTRLAIILAVAAVLSIGLVLLGLWVHDTEDLYPEGLQVGVTTAVAIVPEALVPVVTLTLTLGVRRMAKHNALVRKLNALEQLGNVTDICSDKTGTLTQGKMVATRVWLMGGEEDEEGSEFKAKGEGFDPTSGGLFSLRQNEEEEEEQRMEKEDVKGGLKMAMLICALCNGANVYPKRKAVKADHKKKNKKKRQAKQKDFTLEEGEVATDEDEIEQEEHLTEEEVKELMAQGKMGKEELEWERDGSATEAALFVLAKKVGFDRHHMMMTMEKTREGGEWRKVVEFPFDSTIKKMSVVMHQEEEDKYWLFTKGAPERLLPSCTHALLPCPRAEGEGEGEQETRMVELDEELEGEVRQANVEMAENGLRVLALCFRELKGFDGEEEGGWEREELEEELTFVGLVGIMDPPREGVAESIATCHKAGIVVRMLTGDHPSTSAAIARQIGILGEGCEFEDRIMTSTQFDKMTEDELDRMPEFPLVIARCSPESKVKMVQLLHRANKVVAMTGDGVNDSPAISNADVGIAMGISGTDVTKEASDIILTDDDFSTIVEAIAEGRRIFANIRKFVIHLLVSNIAEAIVLVVGILATLDPPIGPLQVLWLNLVTGPPAAMALGVEPASKDLMDKYKRPIGEPLFTTGTLFDLAVYGLMMGALTISTFIIMRFAYDEDLDTSQATTYVTLTLLLLIHAYNCRRLKNSMFGKGFIKAWRFHLAFLFGMSSVAFTLYTPGINDKVFHQGQPGGWGWLYSGLAAIVFVIGSEAYKVVRKAIRGGWVKKQKRRERRQETELKEQARRRKEPHPGLIFEEEEQHRNGKEQQSQNGDEEEFSFSSSSTEDGED
ncbi:potassium/sodium eff [Balamuthia mandrillaris]